MTRAPRNLWRGVKWLAVVACVLVTTAWITTRSSGIAAIVSGCCGMYLGESKVAIYTVKSTVPSQVIFGPMASRAHGWSVWTFEWTRTPSRWGLVVPLWSLTVLTVVACAGAWWCEVVARRRAATGCCPRCRYDRKGLAPATPCPECGARDQCTPDR